MYRIDGLGEVLPDYDTFVIDLWGVMHHGGQILPEAKALIEAIGRARKLHMFLSNAPRRTAVVQRQLVERGLHEEAAQFVHTSGEEGWQFLKRNPANWQRGFVFEPAGGAEEMYQDLPYEWSTELEGADFALVVGVPMETPNLVPYRDRLAAMAKRDIPLVCVNPDLWVRVGNTLRICAGLVAQLYEQEFGGRAIYFGKPHDAVYQTVLAKTGARDSAHVLAIGDLVETDVRGGRNAGFATCLIEGGVLATRFGFGPGARARDVDLQAEFAKHQVQPNYVSPLFRL